ncbi:MAG: DEAD/DEAH box helicase [Limnochordaceae bacterium]|nr:DEAD/DEAH box helicase [Limnochordaceae bacterium]
MDRTSLIQQAPATYRGFQLDPFQQEAVAAVEAGWSTLVVAPTGTGKTLVADYLIERSHAQGHRVVYTAPIKALSNQKFKEFKRLLGPEAVGILTGDVVINPDAPVTIMTTEVFRNLLHLESHRLAGVRWVIFDEIHYIDDPERGSVWEESLLFLPSDVQFLGLSATIPNAQELAEWLETVQGRHVHVVTSFERAVPLEHHLFEPTLGLCTRERLERHARKLEARGGYWPAGRRMNGHGPRLHYPPVEPLELLQRAGPDRLPALFFFFSRRLTEYYAHELARVEDYLSAQDRQEVRRVIDETLRPYPDSAVARAQAYFGLWERGIGFHHAGLLPAIKDVVEELFERRLIRVLFCTETFAVGVNFPCRTVFFGALQKYDGVQYRPLSNREYFQMAGRAGRRGIDERGYVYAAVDLNDLSIDALPSLDEADVEPLRSQFTLSYNTVLNLLRRFPRPGEAEAVLRRNFAAFQAGRARQRLESEMAKLARRAESQDGRPPGKAQRKARRALERLRKELESYPGPEQFEQNFRRRTRVLEALDYLRGRELTSRGEMACHIHVQELLVTELLADGFLRSLGPAELLALAVAVDYEPRRSEFVPAQLPFALGPVHQAMRAISHAELRHLGYTTVRFAPHLMNAVAAWVHGKGLDECLKLGAVDEGDFVFAVRRGIDLLRQIRTAAEGDPFLEAAVAEAIRAADRDEVAVVL